MIIECLKDNIMNFFTLIVAGLGTYMGIKEWNKSNDYKRAEIIKFLFTSLRDDKVIANIIDMIDWRDGFSYDGKMHFGNKWGKNLFEDEHQLSVSIDRTLSYFNYVCYLQYRSILKEEDTKIFEYEIKRIFDNQHIVNYLHSLSVWCKKINVECTFEYLIKYGKHKKYILEELGQDYSNCYKFFLS